jgi:hypothetical protein
VCWRVAAKRFSSSVGARDLDDSTRHLDDVSWSQRDVFAVKDEESGRGFSRRRRVMMPVAKAVWSLTENRRQLGFHLGHRGKCVVLADHDE